MSKTLYIILVFVYGYAQALPEEEKEKLITAMIPHVQECSKEHGVYEEAVQKAKDSKVLQNLNPCLMGCIYKKSHVINDKGFFDLEKSTEFYKTYFTNESDLKHISDQINPCISVNKEAVNDGEKGCHRGRLLNECLMLLQNEFFDSK